jgi:pimeloyl-ACP methyl ester carboxylesterase
MRTFGKWLGRVLLMIVVLGVGLWVVGPYEPVDVNTKFDQTQLSDGVQAYFDQSEAAFSDIRPDSNKRVIWANEPEVKTPLSIVYFHGFSASSEEIRPVPDNVAAALGANLVYTRFQGHGRDGDAMAEATASNWMNDAVEALAVARAVGDKVIILTTSTGGTIAALALHEPELQNDVAGVVFVSPNFGINNPAAGVLPLPAARYWVPLVAGETRKFDPLNDGQAAHWTTTYPTVATLPMAAAVKAAVARDYSEVRVPALFQYAQNDRVVVAQATDRIAAQWGGPGTIVRPQLDDGDDPFFHVIAGDIMSPGQTARSSAAIFELAKML